MIIIMENIRMLVEIFGSNIWSIDVRDLTQDLLCVKLYILNLPARYYSLSLSLEKKEEETSQEIQLVPFVSLSNETEQDRRKNREEEEPGPRLVENLIEASKTP